MTTIAIPQVNNNGNSKDSLLAQLQHAIEPLRDAIEALSNCDYSHGRNFQTVAFPSEAQRARDEHVDRLRSLHRVRQELQELAEAISRQGR
jgi:hypothetical protein